MSTPQLEKGRKEVNQVQNAYEDDALLVREMILVQKTYLINLLYKAWSRCACQRFTTFQLYMQ